MKVPACPMPTHQTKFTIAKPQATGMLIPQMPTPRMKSQARARKNIMSRPKATTKPIHQVAGCRLRRTIEPIVSLTVS